MGRADLQPWQQPHLKVFRVFINGNPTGPLRDEYDAQAAAEALVSKGEKRAVEVRGQMRGGGWHTVIQYRNGRLS